MRAPQPQERRRARLLLTIALIGMVVAMAGWLFVEVSPPLWLIAVQGLTLLALIVAAGQAWR